MKKYFYFTVLIFTMASGAYASNNIVASGTYNNLLANGKLELYAGSFPAKWRYVGNAVEYQANGGFADGGRFIFKDKGKSFLIRQDWSFTLNAGEKYYLKAKIRTKNFKASKAVVLVFNNGWKKSFEMPIPQGSGDWNAIEKIFDGMDSNSGYYSVAVQIAGVKSGELEVSDIAVEPATARAFELSTAYLKEISVPELVVLGRREYIPASNAVLCCRYFGDKKLKKVSYSAANLNREAQIDANGIIKFDFNGLVPGKYIVKVKAGDKTIDLAITIKPGFSSVAGKVLNNFHTVVAEIAASAGKGGNFVNSRNGWMLFVMPEDMAIRVNGYKKTIKNGDFALLPMGNLSFKVEKGNGKIRISEVAETSFYQLAAGPYPKELPKHDWEFFKKYQQQTVMTFLGSGLQGSMRKFRAGHNRLLGHAAIGKIIDHKSGGQIKFPGMNPKAYWFDGIYIDELALGMPKSLIYYLKHLDKVVHLKDRDSYLYVAGDWPNTPYTAELISKTINMSGNSKIISEIYLGNNHTSEKDVKKQIQKLVQRVEQMNSICPGINPYIGFHFCHSNVAGSLTIDNEPEADHRILLDMQMHMIATHPAFKNIGMIGFWGDNYSDLERTRYVMELIRHYVIEGKTEMYSKIHGLKLVPGIISNASFRNGTENWTVKGSVAQVFSNAGKLLKRFNPIKDVTVALAMRPGKELPAVTQTMKNLKVGQKYSLKIVSSSGNVDVKINGAIQKPAVEYRTNKIICGREYLFTASAQEMTLELVKSAADAKKTVYLHYVTVMPYIGE